MIILIFLFISLVLKIDVKWCSIMFAPLIKLKYNLSLNKIHIPNKEKMYKDQGNFSNI